MIVMSKTCIKSCFYFNTKLTVRKNGVNNMELKQIGPRIRKEVYDKFAKDCENTRYSQSVIIEKLIINYLKDRGYEFNSDIRD